MTGSSSWITKERRLAIYIRDHFTCLYCGLDLHGCSPRQFGLDHLDDLVAGGGHKGANHKSDNLVTACRSCNSARGNKPWKEYATGGAIVRINDQRHFSVNVELAKAIIAGTAEWEDR